MIHVVIPSWLCASLAGLLLYRVVKLLAPNISGNRQVVATVLLILAIFFFLGAVGTVRIF